MILLAVFGLLMVLPLTESIKLDITDVSLHSSSTNLTNEGVVLVKSGEELFVVCREGHGDSGKRWGKRESMVACRQLGFKGGWTIDVKKPASIFATRFVNNFDCSGVETSLGSCLNFNDITVCPNLSYPAGVHCYSNFSAHLIGGSAPNAGRVVVQYDDMWSSVCYESSPTKRWTFVNAQVVCKELGFPGTMFERRGQGQATYEASIYDYKCMQGYSSLHECLPSPPFILPPEYQGPSCGTGSNGIGNEAVVICTVPGYVGCFEPTSYNNLKETSHELYLDCKNMTVRMCRNHCRELGVHLTGLYNGSTCFCLDTVVGYTHFGDDRCNLECTGQELEACGGSWTISVYSVTNGICDDPLNGTDIYYYGDIFEDFTCAPGHQLIGTKSIQCVMDESGGMKWSHDFPECNVIMPTTPPVTMVTPGSTTNPSASPSDMDNTLSLTSISSVVVAVILGVAIVICICGVLCYYYRLKNNAAGQQEQHIYVQMNPTVEPNPLHKVQLNPRSSVKERNEDGGEYIYPSPPQRPVEASVITHDQLRLTNELGSGQYGVVWLAETKMITSNGIVTKVAVKTTKEDAPNSEKEDLQRELNLMQRLKPHPNVLQALGSCLDNREYMARGTLRNVLMSSRRLYDYANTREQDMQSSLSQTQLMIFARQVASGMDFITSNKLIHRDVAARNVLVGEDLVCKVSDFGLARDEEEYHAKSNIKLPLRWMAIESWADGIHTKESDVWSYGILLWEIVTLGARPYPGMGTTAVIRDLQHGLRMPKPVHCVQQVYDIMRACWAFLPKERPSFAEIIRNIDEIIELKIDYLLLDKIDKAVYENTGKVDEDEKV